MIAPSREQITISLGDQQAVIVEVGGGIRSYSAGSRELVDGYAAHEMGSSGRGQVLIPWPNRLEGGSYEFDGKHHQLPLNEPEQPQRDSRPGPMGDVERSRAGGTSRRDAACPLSTARLSVFAQNQHRICAIG